ncbi:ribosome silencing factor [Leucobacter iarius]|uniref:Ribosomal silencing factor RsfS n=1 Tax=Leucobacter iarius TaxID=333963 RepID=A0ABN2LLS2_9MICO
MSDTTDVLNTLETAVLAADAKGATEPVALDVGEFFPYADAFLLLTGSVERNVQAISDAIEDALNESGVRTLRREGREGGRWVLLDFGGLIVHVFHQEEREFYQLERLWSDCPVIDTRGILERAADLRSTPEGDVK